MPTVHTDITALDWYARDGPDDVTDGQELRAYQLVESIAHLHGTVSLGSTRFFDSSYFDQYARHHQISERHG